jgi:putative membrane protein
MHTATNLLIALVALLHLYFLVLEMFLWDKPTGRRVFGLSPELAAQTKALAANQGLYNGFLAAGLVWGLTVGHLGGPGAVWGLWIKIFFLSCIVVAGIFGAVTVNRRILFVQALPAFVALVLVHLV